MFVPATGSPDWRIRRLMGLPVGADRESAMRALTKRSVHSDYGSRWRAGL
jgi:hypothetical protein